MQWYTQKVVSSNSGDSATRAGPTALERSEKAPEGPEEPLSWLLLKRENHQLRKTPTYVCNIILINPRHQDSYVHPKDDGDSQVPRWDREKGRVTACLPATGLASKPAVWKQTQRHHLCYAKQRCPVLAGYSSPKVFCFLFFSNVTVI